MNWVSYVTVRRDIVELIVKMWIHVALILVLTLAPVFTPTKDLSATVLEDTKENTVKNEISANPILASLATNAIKRELTVINASRISAIPVPACTMDVASKSMKKITYVRVNRAIQGKTVTNSRTKLTQMVDTTCPFSIAPNFQTT